MSSGATPSRISSSTSAATSSASARSPPDSSIRTAPLGEQARRADLEQPALQMVQRGARGARVVLGAVGQLDVARGQRLQQLDGGGPPRERGAAGLVGQRHAHLGLGAPGQRLHGVQLQRRQVVEAVQEHGPGAPRGRALTQRVQRGAREALLVEHAEPLQPPVVGGVERGQLVGVGGRPLPTSAARG